MSAEEILGTPAERDARAKRNAAAYAEATAVTMTPEMKLEALVGSGWVVHLTGSGLGGPRGEWKLVLERRDGSGSSFTYRGTLSSVVARAHAGEKGD